MLRYQWRIGSLDDKHSNTMKFIVSVAIFLVSINLWAQEGKLTTEEKNEISEHLQQSYQHLEDILVNLSQEQWNYKPVDSVCRRSPVDVGCAWWDSHWTEFQ